MLVLTRRDGEGLRIGKDIFVHLIRTKDGEVRVGIDAPRAVDVVRLELLPEKGRTAREAGK